MKFIRIFICIFCIIIIIALVPIRKIVYYCASKIAPSNNPSYNCLYELKSDDKYGSAKKGSMVSLICKVKKESDNSSISKRTYEMYEDSDKNKLIAEINSNEILDEEVVYNIRGYVLDIQSEDNINTFYIDTISADKVAEEIYNNSNTKNCELKIDEANANIIKKNNDYFAQYNGTYHKIYTSTDANGNEYKYINVPNNTEPVGIKQNDKKKQEGNISVSIPEISFYKDYSKIQYIVSLEKKHHIIKIKNMHITASSKGEIIQDKDIGVLKKELSSFTTNRSGIKYTDNGYDWIDDYDYFNSIDCKNDIDFKITIDYTDNFIHKTDSFEFNYD